MEGIVILLSMVVVSLFINAVLEERRVDALVKRVEQLERQSTGFLPASYDYLRDLEDWATKKGK